LTYSIFGYIRCPFNSDRHFLGYGVDARNKLFRNICN